MTAQRRAVGNLTFTVLTLAEATRTVLDLAASVESRGNPGIAVHFANAFNVALARNDSHYARVLNDSDYVFSDGVPVTWAGKRAYPDLAGSWERVYGPDVMTAVLSQSTATTPRHYLLGGSPDVLEQLEASIAQKFPNAVIVGAESPPFTAPTANELRERDQRIQDSGATLVWVGLGTPKQDFEVNRLAASIPVVACAVGAAFDFLAGTTPQAPAWMQRSGLEWAYRFAHEPRRLAKRYLWGNIVFLGEAIRTVRESSN